jgi:uncharacterized membrane-anchored protein
LYQESIVQNGETTILRTLPIDPRDLLRGEYVILRYALTRDEQVRTVASQMSNTGSVYIGLTEDANGVASVTSASADKQSVGDLWITATVKNGRVSIPEIEQYFVPEGAGKDIERLGTSISVEVAIKNGNARVIQLLDEDLNPINPEDYLD